MLRKLVIPNNLLDFNLVSWDFLLCLPQSNAGFSTSLYDPLFFRILLQCYDFVCDPLSKTSSLLVSLPASCFHSWLEKHNFLLLDFSVPDLHHCLLLGLELKEALIWELGQRGWHCTHALSFLRWVQEKNPLCDQLFQYIIPNTYLSDVSGKYF